MNFAEIKKCDIANGPGVRVSLFVSGCTHHCPGCFNEIAWDFSYGNPFTAEIQKELLTALAPSYIRGLTLLGGEPLERVNQQGLLPFLKKVKETYPEKDIWCYTGYRLEEDIMGRMLEQWEETKEMLSMIDVLVDGRFEERLKDISLRFRGLKKSEVPYCHDWLLPRFWFCFRFCLWALKSGS